MRADLPELLAPAGDWEALKAAVANGADAVYFGLPLFNARFRATNFSAEELPNVVDYLHRRGVRAYVTFNTLIFTEELPQALEYLNLLAAAGVDAVIVQDLGLALLIQKLFPGLAVHASTQTTQTEPAGIGLLAELGIQRVILARELSLAEIGKIRERTIMPVEVFVHGALCVAYSGQCLTSEALGGRSANRGQCAQACRMPYDLMVDGQQRDLGDRAYLLSPQDLAAYDLVPQLAALGVCSLKIEGRLKGGPYVAAATRAYRAALDALAAGQPFTLPERDRLDLEQTFSRGLFHGFLDGVNHQLTAPARFPKHRGVWLGTVVGHSRQGVLVELVKRGLALEEQVKPGDGVVFDESRPEEKEPGGRVVGVSLDSLPPGIVELRFRREDLVPALLKIGSLVWKTDDPAVRHRLERTYASDKQVHRQKLDFRLEGRAGGPLRLVGTAGALHAAADWPGPLVRAEKHPATAESLREQLGRLGETPFELGEVRLDFADPVLIPKSVLNELRRQVVAGLRQEAASPKPAAVPIAALAELRECLGARRQPHETSSDEKKQAGQESHPTGQGIQLAVLARTLPQLRALAEWKQSEGSRPEQVYCDFEDVRRYRDAVAIARSAGLWIGLATLRIFKPGEETWLRLLADCGPDGVLIRNLGGLAYFRRHHPHLRLVGDFSLNVANDLAARWYRQQGLDTLTPSYDLNWDQLATLVAASDGSWYEAVIHYQMPMFHMEHCVFAAFLSEGKDWRDCGRPCDVHRLEVRDRASSASFPVIPDAGCRNTVFNAVPQSAAEYLTRMLRLGLRRFRIELLREKAEEIGPLLALYQRVLAGEVEGDRAWRQVRAINQLGVTRGTLQLL